MTILEYKRRRDALAREAPVTRSMCWRCRQPGFGCYCAELRPLAIDVHFVILIHPIEVRRRIATGRMAHLCLTNSTLIAGHDFADRREVGAFVEDPANHCVVLYPGRDAINLSRATASARRGLAPDGRRLVVFVIDGTWNTAGRMMRNAYLRDLPRISFDPGAPSRFRVRLQPAPECLSTIEAVHRTIDLLSPNDVAVTRAHDALLDVFDHLVEYQLLFDNHARHAAPQN